MPAKKKAAKAPAKPAAKKAVAKPAAKSTPKKASKPVAKPAAKKTAKPAAKPVAKKAAAKPVVKPSVKKAAKPSAKSAPKVAPKAAVKPAAKKSVKPSAPVKPVAKAKVVAKPVKKSEVKKAPAAKPEPKKPETPVKATAKATKTVIEKPAVSKTVKQVSASRPLMRKPEAPKPAAVGRETGIKIPVKQAIKNLKQEAKSKPKNVDISTIKTSVATSVRYQPDFTKSVLDSKTEQKQQGPMVRYSDSDLAEFKELIQRKLEAAKKELGYLQGLITRKDEMGGDDGDGRYMTMEDGSVSMEREQLSQMASRQITYIDHLEKALMRIENKTYGVCRVTGKLIDKARLRAVPHATLSMEAKLGVVKAPSPSSGE